MEYKNFFQRKTMSLSELEVYYRERRKENFEKNKSFRGVKLRKILHPILICGLKVMHLFSGQKIIVIDDKRIHTKRPIIFAATHIGWDDIEMIFTAIHDHAYLFWGDPHESYRTMDGFLLNLNGAIIIDTGDKADRNIGKETCIKWLNQGGSLLIFPEGVWNTSENQLIKYLFSGVAEMAICTEADIIPVAIMQYGKEFRINIGKNISQGRWSMEEKQMLTNELRDVMATLMWEIYETQPITKRKNLPKNESEIYKKSFINMGKGIVTWRELVDSSFRPKDITAPKEAFSFLDRLIPCRENGFLFRKW